MGKTMYLRKQHYLWFTCCAGVMCWVLSTSGAFADDSETAAALEKIVVTGSHIKRIDIEGASPLLSIGRVEIEKSGVRSISDLLRRLPEFNGGSLDDQSFSQLAPGSAGISLHGLGQDNALVLLNGRRVANYGFGQEITESFVDLNSIPLAMIERVEVLKDGASAIYGSDAIAGVVNFVLRRDFEGVKVTTEYGRSTRGDADAGSVNIIAGHAMNNTRITALFRYYGRKELQLKDRRYSRSADHRRHGGYDDRSSTGNPGSVVLSSTGGVVPDPTCPTARNNGSRCLMDLNRFMSAVPETERSSGTFIFEHDLNKSLTGILEFGIQHIETNASSTPLSVTGRGAPLVPATHPNNPFGEDVSLLYRITELGGTNLEVETDAWRLLTGIKGELSTAWNWEVAALYSSSDSQSEVHNSLNKTMLQQRLNNGTFNPFGGATNNPAVIDSLRATSTREGKSWLYSVDAKINGELMELPAGPLGVAAGIERRHEALDDSADQATLTGAVSGGVQIAVEGKRDVTSLFVEFAVPITESLEVQLAARHERFSDSGNTVDPKIAFRFQPTENLLFRGSAATAFRAPSLTEKNLSNFYVFSTSGMELHFVGNPKLEPESAVSYSLGSTVQITPKLTWLTDIWKMQQKDVIDVDFAGIGPALMTATGNRANVMFANLGKLRAGGVDMELRFDIGKTAWGVFDSGLRVSYLGTYKRRFTDVGNFVDYDGHLASESPIGEGPEPDAHPRRKGTAHLDWSQTKFSGRLQLNYVSSYEDARGYPVTGRKHLIDSLLTVDSQLSYTGIAGATLTFGVNNLLDEKPPFAFSATVSNRTGYDVTTANPVGRFVFARLSYDFF